MVESILDVRGELCPMPVIKARLALGKLGKGEALRVEATDPGSLPDLAAFCRSWGHKLLSQEERDGLFITLLEKG